MRYYDGPIDIYDGEGELLVSGIPALLEADQDGRWWGRLRDEEVVPPTLSEGMIGVRDGARGRVRFMVQPEPGLVGEEDRNVDFEGMGDPPFQGGEGGRPHPLM